MYKQFRKWFRNTRRQNALILMYHQVCERKDDPWELAVNPSHFHAQLEYLKRNFEVVSMEGLAAGLANGNGYKTVAVTFDDGFRDNYINAAPVMDWLQIPATFYVATTAIQEQKLYWWDALQQIIFHSETLPRRFKMAIGSKDVQFDFHTDHFLSNKLLFQIFAWNYNLPIPNERVALFMMLWSNLKPLPYTQQNEVLAQIRDWAGSRDLPFSDCVAMDVREIQMLSQNPLFSIGAHSVHHAMLSEQNPVDQAYEVNESKVQIEKWLGKPVSGFAYPYGNYNEVTQRLLRESGFRYAVSTESKPVTVADDPFALPRIQVKNWSVYEFASVINEMIHE